MTDCEQIHFTEAAENAELRYILSEMAKLKTSRAEKFKGGIVAAIKIKDFCRFYPVIVARGLVLTETRDSFNFFYQ